MKNIQFTESPGVPHASMEEDFLTHKKCSEWWYCTGYLNDETGRMFSFQFTLARLKVFGIRFHLLLTALTDFQTGKHYCEQKTAFFGKNIITTADKTAFGDKAEITYSKNQFASRDRMQLRMKGKNFSVNVDMNAVKPPVWHCDNGVLQMGVLDDLKQTTFYYSYTNLASTGKIVLADKEYNVKGKSWFDKQGGTYTITNRWVNWEWFSMRFFDGEEVMLFAFPQDNYYDGTFIGKTGDYRRLNDYVIKPIGFTQAGGYKFSNGWTLSMKGVKGEEYT